MKSTKVKRRKAKVVARARPHGFHDLAFEPEFVELSPAWYSWSYASKHFGAGGTWNSHNWQFVVEFSVSRWSANIALSVGPLSGHVAAYF